MPLSRTHKAGFNEILQVTIGWIWANKGYGILTKIRTFLKLSRAPFDLGSWCWCQNVQNVVLISEMYHAYPQDWYGLVWPASSNEISTEQARYPNGWILVHCASTICSNFLFLMPLFWTPKAGFKGMLRGTLAWTWTTLFSEPLDLKRWFWWQNVQGLVLISKPGYMVALVQRGTLPDHSFFDFGLGSCGCDSCQHMLILWTLQIMQPFFHN